MQQLHRNGFFDDKATRLLRGSLPALSDEHGRDQDFVRALSEHMVIAGLVQDIGELPFKAATDLFFYADPAVVAEFSEDLEIRAHDLGHKDIFTLHGIIDLFDRKPLLRDRFDIGLLAHMITGVRIGTIEQSPPLAALRHILNGVVDADRLDYVHRDAHHTIGVGHLDIGEPGRPFPHHLRRAGARLRLQGPGLQLPHAARHSSLAGLLRAGEPLSFHPARRGALRIPQTASGVDGEGVRRAARFPDR